MAYNPEEIQIRIDTSIDNAATSKSLKELKKSIQELKGIAATIGPEAGEAFETATAAAAEFQDRIDDVNDALKNAKGEGIEGLKSGFGDLTTALGNLDFDKAGQAIDSMNNNFNKIDFNNISQNFDNFKLKVNDFASTIKSKIGEQSSTTMKGFGNVVGGVSSSLTSALGGNLKGAIGGLGTAFKGLGQIIKANPLLTLTSVIVLLIANFEKFKEVGGALGKVFTGVSFVIENITQAFKDLTDALGLTDFAAQKLADNEKSRSEKNIENLKTELALLQKRQGLYGEVTTQRQSAVQTGTQIQYQNDYINAKLKNDKEKTEESARLEKEAFDKLEDYKIEAQKNNSDQVIRLQRNVLESNYKKDIAEANNNAAKIAKIELNYAIDKIEANKKITEQELIDADLAGKALTALYDNNKKTIEKYYKYIDATKAKSSQKELDNNEGFQTVVKKQIQLLTSQETLENAIGQNKEIRRSIEEQAEQDSYSARLSAQNTYYKTVESLSKEAALKAKQRQEDLEKEEKTKIKNKLSDLKDEYTLLREQDDNFNKDQVEILENYRGILASFVKDNAKKLEFNATEVKSYLANLNKESLQDLEKLQEIENKRIRIADERRIAEAITLKEETDAKIKQAEDERDILLKNAKLTADERILIVTNSNKQILGLTANFNTQLKQYDQERLDQGADAAARQATLSYKLRDAIGAINAGFTADLNALNANEKADLERAEFLGKSKEEIETEYRQRRENLEKESDNNILQAKIANINKYLSAATSLNQSLTGLSSAYNDYQQSLLKSGEKLTIKQQKGQFNREKALGISAAGINTAQGITGAFAQTATLGPVGSAILAGSIGAIGAAQIALIAAKKFNPDDSGSGSSASNTSIGNLVGSITDIGSKSSSISAPELFDIGNTSYNNDRSTLRVAVVESDIRNMTQKVNVLESASYFNGP